MTGLRAICESAMRVDQVSAVAPLKRVAPEELDDDEDDEELELLEEELEAGGVLLLRPQAANAKGITTTRRRSHPNRLTGFKKSMDKKRRS